MKYVSDWTINKEDREVIEKYIDNTDVIITEENNEYRISTREEDLFFSSFDEFLNHVRENLRIMIEEGYIEA